MPSYDEDSLLELEQRRRKAYEVTVLCRIASEEYHEEISLLRAQIKVLTDRKNVLLWYNIRTPERYEIDAEIGIRELNLMSSLGRRRRNLRRLMKMSRVVRDIEQEQFRRLRTFRKKTPGLVCMGCVRRKPLYCTLRPCECDVCENCAYKSLFKDRLCLGCETHVEHIRYENGDVVSF